MIFNNFTFKRALARKFIPFCLVLCAAVFQTAWADADYSHVVAFGDSLSDPGNALVLSGGATSVAPFAPIPSLPYSSGRFSNSKVWIERLAEELDLKKGGKAALGNPGQHTNYAVGGAQAGGNESYDLTGQVTLFLYHFRNSAPSDGLYVLWLGGNDIRAALENPAMAVPIITAGVQAEADNIGALYSAGARNFLILNAPNLGLVPAVTGQGSGAIAAAVFLSEAYNAILSGALDGLELALPGIKILRFDASGLLSDVVADPDAFGLTNVLTPCLTFFVAVNAVCEKPNTHLFWDGIHPTKKAHEIFAEVVEEVLDDDRDDDDDDDDDDD